MQLSSSAFHSLTPKPVVLSLIPGHRVQTSPKPHFHKHPVYLTQLLLHLTSLWIPLSISGGPSDSKNCTSHPCSTRVSLWLWDLLRHTLLLGPVHPQLCPAVKTLEGEKMEEWEKYISAWPRITLSPQRLYQKCYGLSLVSKSRTHFVSGTKNLALAQLTSKLS